MKNLILKDMQDKKSIKVKFGHRIDDSEDMVWLPFEEESDGTKKLFAYAGPWLDGLEKGRVFLVDELDTSLHPLMVRFLLQLIHNFGTNKNNAQLVFTTHDTSIPDQKLMRRDQTCDRVLSDRSSGEHGRIEVRKIWTTTELNDYLEFPHVGQAFAIERHSTNKKTGKKSYEIAYGITSKNPEQCNAQSILATNRNHWTIENRCHYVIDWNFDEDRSRIRTGYGPENTTRLRRFAIGIIKSKKVRSVAQKMRQLNQNVRLVPDTGPSGVGSL